MTLAKQPMGCNWRGASGGVCVAGGAWRGVFCVCLVGCTSGGFTWWDRLGVVAGAFGVGGDAGEAEDGSQEADHKSHNDRTLNPGGGGQSWSHRAQAQDTDVICSVSPTGPFGQAWASTAENGSNPTRVPAGSGL